MDVKVDIPFDGSGHCLSGTPQMPCSQDAQSAPASERDRVLRQLQIERTPLAYLLLDLHLRLVDWNPSAERVFGYSKAEVLGMGPPFEKIVPRSQWEHVKRILTRVRSGDMSANSMNENLTKDGRLITCEWFNTPLFDDDGQFAGLLCLAQDITERRRLEEQIRHSQKMQAVGQLAGGVAHDFNNQLTIIIGYTEMLLEILEDNEFAREPLELIRKAGEHCGALTRQLLVYSRMQVHLPAVLDLNKVVRDCEESLRKVVGDDIELITMLDPDLGNIEADPSLLEQVLLNLAVNARDAMPGGGRLMIETVNDEHLGDAAHASDAPRSGPLVCLKVSDSGNGMSDDVKSHLFEPFFTTKEQGKGTGLGLPVVHGIIQQSDGHIEVASQPNAGTTFKIYLPRADKANKALSGT
jgi:two-component system, cell cycle sensor histidine kinase and response regulator CckA